MASLKKLAITFGAATGMAALGGYYVYNQAYDYSNGVRPGVVTKISKKGSLCKTWEGEMMLNSYSNVGGQGTSSMFLFTVMDKELAKKIEQRVVDAAGGGVPLALEYRQVKWRISCLQDSEYVVTGIKDSGSTSEPTIRMIAPVPAPRKR